MYRLHWYWLILKHSKCLLIYQQPRCLPRQYCLLLVSISSCCSPPTFVQLLCSYDNIFNAEKPELNTCNPGKKIAVSHTLSPQPVAEGTEVIFTYDVKFTVSVV